VFRFGYVYGESFLFLAGNTDKENGAPKLVPREFVSYKEIIVPTQQRYTRAIR
jgi:hypothetical protein